MDFKSTPMYRFGLTLMAVCFAVAAEAQQQCAVFKSEIGDVQKYEQEVNHLVDSLNTYAEKAAYAARFDEGRTNAKKVQYLAGEALAAAQEAMNYAGEAQYHAEVCGIDAVVTYAIRAEELSIDVRDLAETAYVNAKKASTAAKLGDIHFYMRRSLQASIDARKISEKATWAAMDAHASCTHTDDVATGKN